MDTTMSTGKKEKYTEKSGKNMKKIVKERSKKKLENTEEPVEKRKKNGSVEEPKVEGVQVVDSFFKTKEGTNYVAIAPKRSAVELEKQNKEFEELKNRKRKIKDAKEFKQESKQKDLEPWKAKKQQNGIHEFKGKKMKLEKEVEDNLHPSWLAKQKQKGIKDFQGKKIVFDEETKVKVQVKASQSVAVEKEAQESLHPSWLAKQKERGIQPFKGTKISFEDE